MWNLKLAAQFVVAAALTEKPVCLVDLSLQAGAGWSALLLIETFWVIIWRGRSQGENQTCCVVGFHHTLRSSPIFKTGSQQEASLKQKVSHLSSQHRVSPKSAAHLRPDLCQFPKRSLREIEGGLSVLMKDAQAWPQQPISLFWESRNGFLLNFEGL